MPHPDDEPEQNADKNFIYIVSLGEGENLDNITERDITERKVEDWTGEFKWTGDNEKQKHASIMMDKKDVLYVAADNAIYAVVMNTLKKRGKVLTVGPNTCKGVVRFDDSTRPQ